MASLATRSRMTWRNGWKSRLLLLTIAECHVPFCESLLACLQTGCIIVLNGNTNLTWHKSLFRSCPGFGPPVTSPLFHSRCWKMCSRRFQQQNKRRVSLFPDQVRLLPYLMSLGGVASSLSCTGASARQNYGHIHENITSLQIILLNF